MKVAPAATRLAVRYACHPLLVLFWGATGLVAFLPIGRSGGMPAPVASLIFGFCGLPVMGSVWFSRLVELRRQLTVLPVRRGRALLVFAFVGPLLSGIGVGIGIAWWPGGWASAVLPAANLALSIVVALILVGVFVLPGLSDAQALFSLVPFGIALSLGVVGTGPGRSPALLLVLVGVLAVVSWAAVRQERRAEAAPRADPEPEAPETVGPTAPGRASGSASPIPAPAPPAPARPRSPMRVYWWSRWYYLILVFALPLAAWTAGGSADSQASGMLVALLIAATHFGDATGLRRWLLATPWSRRRTFRLVAVPAILAGILTALVFVVGAWTTADVAPARFGRSDLDEEILVHDPGLGSRASDEFDRAAPEEQAGMLSTWLRARYGLSVAPRDVPPPGERRPGNPAWSSLQGRVMAVVRGRGAVLGGAWLLAFLALLACGSSRGWWTSVVGVAILLAMVGMAFSVRFRYEVFRGGVPIVDALASRPWIAAPATIAASAWLIRRIRRRIYDEEWTDLAKAGR